MTTSSHNLDTRLRTFIYRHFLQKGRSPLVREMEEGLSASSRDTKDALARLSQTHAFVLNQAGELWRAAPFSAVPTAFPVRIGKKSWYGNCVWDALGIPAMLGKDAVVDAACSCCNLGMPLHVRDGKLVEKAGIVHFAVPACQWYQDIVFT